MNENVCAFTKCAFTKWLDERIARILKCVNSLSDQCLFGMLTMNIWKH